MMLQYWLFSYSDEMFLDVQRYRDVVSAEAGAFERISMLSRKWRNIVIYVLGLAVMFGLFFATFIVARMCASGIGWPICFLQ